MTLAQKLRDLRAKYASRGAGWDKQFADEMMRVVLDHHGIDYRALGQHTVFANMAPLLFREERP